MRPIVFQRQRFRQARKRDGGFEDYEIGDVFRHGLEPDLEPVELAVEHYQVVDLPLLIPTGVRRPLLCLAELGSLRDREKVISDVVLDLEFDQGRRYFMRFGGERVLLPGVDCNKVERQEHNKDTAPSSANGGEVTLESSPVRLRVYVVVSGQHVYIRCSIVRYYLLSFDYRQDER